MNERTQDPAEGMEMSYEEILHIMRLCHKDQVCPVYRGAKKWLTEKTEEEIVQIRSGRVWGRQDTLKYDLTRFASSKDRNVSDVLKKLPGINVEENGTIKYNGKVIIDDALKAAIDAYYAQYGAK